VIAAACGRTGASLTVTDPCRDLIWPGGGPPAGQRRHRGGGRTIAGAVDHARALREGLAHVRWPGRFEQIADHPDVIVDGAHTLESADALVRAVRELRDPVRVHLVFGMLKGKPHAAVARTLVPMAEHVWCPTLTHPRALPAGELVRIIREAGAWRMR